MQNIVLMYAYIEQSQERDCTTIEQHLMYIAACFLAQS